MQGMSLMSSQGLDKRTLTFLSDLWMFFLITSHLFPSFGRCHCLAVAEDMFANRIEGWGAVSELEAAGPQGAWGVGITLEGGNLTQDQQTTKGGEGKGEARLTRDECINRQA